ncbi:MAG: hypothetical protein EHM59_11060 [Betaproteobacteria bacterium]|nr:MAG: hypothetical protein EHM59_11060 [Betaproteobacteria bacterium]
MIAEAIQRCSALFAFCANIRKRVPPYQWWLGLAVLASAITYLAWLAYGYGTQSDRVRGESLARLSRLENENAQLEKYNAALRSEVAVLERQLQIERASYEDLARQFKVLSVDNARLKEDVALVQAISGTNAKVDGVKLSSVRVQPNGVAGEYSYRIVLLQTGARLRPFQGSYQLVVDMVQDGTRRGLTLPPAAGRGERPYQLDFRVHQRIEGTFQVDPNAVVRSVEVRVYEHGQSQPKLMQTVTLS